VAPAAAAPPPVIAAPVAATPAVVAPPPARVIDAAELALLMKRAKEMLISGDIPAARLLLRRAADAQEPTAALMLAQTYDPAILGTQDARNIIPDPETARVWYQKAAQLGSTDAQRRLAQMQN
jgi:TPR repeat protein